MEAVALSKKKKKMTPLEALDYYYSLGVDRSYKKVAEAAGVSVTSIQAWANNYDWQAEVKRRDTANYKEIAARTDNDIINNTLQYRKIISASIATYVKQLKDGVVKISSPSDFIKLAELDIKLAQLLKDEEIEKDDTVTLKIDFVNED
jgi:hypothetical protein